MIDATNAKLRFSTVTNYFGNDIFEAELSISAEAPYLEDDTVASQRIIKEKIHAVLYGDLMQLIDQAHQVSIGLAGSVVGRSYIDSAFGPVFEFKERELPVEFSQSQNSEGQVVVTGKSSVYFPLTLDKEFGGNSSYINIAEQHLRGSIQTFLYDELIESLLNAHSTAMSFSAGYEQVHHSFEPVFESMKIKLPAS